MDKDYYAILGVDPGVTLEEIKSAYRRKAKALHPDHYAGGSEPFRDLHEAYTVLSDPDCRRAYDDERAWETRRPARAAGAGWVEPMRPARSRSAPVEPLSPNDWPYGSSPKDPFDEIVSRLWGDLGFDDPFSDLFAGARETVDFTVDVPLTPQQARRGGRVQVSIPLPVRCPACRGQGWVGVYRCQSCRGGGAVEQMRPVTISFGPGVADGETAIVSLDQLGMPDRRLAVRFQLAY